MAALVEHREQTIQIQRSGRMHLANLDSVTRGYMLDEINADLSRDALYLSPRLSERGRRDYPVLLLAAAGQGDAASLAAGLRRAGRLNATETATRAGQTVSRRVPVSAADTLAEGEFNRFYVRGLSRRAAAENVPELVIYRAKQVRQPRPESEARIGTAIDPARLLSDMRIYASEEDGPGIPPGPNSGLSVRLPS
jgi:hypothetical protein